MSIDVGWDSDSDIFYTSKSFESNGLLFIGGMKDKKGFFSEGFRGCVTNVYINSISLDLYNDIIEKPSGGLLECH